MTAALNVSSRYAAAARYLVTSAAAGLPTGSVASTTASCPSMRSVTSNVAPCAHGRQMRGSPTNRTDQEVTQRCHHHPTRLRAVWLPLRSLSFATFSTPMNHDLAGPRDRLEASLNLLITL